MWIFLGHTWNFLSFALSILWAVFCLSNLSRILLMVWWQVTIIYVDVLNFFEPIVIFVYIYDNSLQPMSTNVLPVMFRHCRLLFSCHLQSFSTSVHHILTNILTNTLTNILTNIFINIIILISTTTITCLVASFDERSDPTRYRSLKCSLWIEQITFRWPGHIHSDSERRYRVFFFSLVSPIKVLSTKG